MASRIDIGGLTELIEKYKIRSYPDTAEAYDLIYDFLKDETMKQRKPFFIVDLGVVMKKYEQWVACLPRVTPYYAVKCNPDPAIITVLGMMGCNFDCASQTEIAIVQDALQQQDSDGTRIIFANPIKDEEHIQYARANDVDMTVFDSPDELYKIKLYHTEAQLFLRINIDNPHSVINFGSKFGAKMENIGKLIDICNVLELNLVGVSFHVGTGCSDSNQYYLALELCKQVFELARTKNVIMRYIDIGGGFPGVDTPELTFDSVAEAINDAIDRLFGPDSEFPETKFIAEPGRFFVAASHTLVVNIIGKKITYEEDENGEKRKVFVYHINDGVYGSFNCVLTERTIPTFEPYNERNGNTFAARIFGPTCDSIDSIPGEYMLPELVLGERLYVPNFGAYTTALASDFNGFAKTLSHYIIKFDRNNNRDDEEASQSRASKTGTTLPSSSSSTVSNASSRSDPPNMISGKSSTSPLFAPSSAKLT
jgi:ornithine decarboxylase